MDLFNLMMLSQSFKTTCALLYLGWKDIREPTGVFKTGVFLQVLRDIKTVEPFQWSEVQRMRTTLLTRDEADLKDNNHILNLLTHLQAVDVPLKTIDLLRDMPAMIHVCFFCSRPVVMLPQ